MNNVDKSLDEKYIAASAKANNFRKQVATHIPNYLVEKREKQRHQKVDTRIRRWFNQKEHLYHLDLTKNSIVDSNHGFFVRRKNYNG